MKRNHFLFLALFAAILLLLSSIVSAQDVQKIEIPEGFNWLYVPIFIGGMIAHYSKKIYQLFGWALFLKKFVDNFFGWFFNKFHWTLIAGAAAMILGFVEGYGLNVGFGTLNALAIGASLAAGYIADSTFNTGVIK